MKQLWEIFWSFFKIGLFTFGGGYAMIPLIQREVIDHRKWIPASEFLDLLTLAQSVPGPIAINTADRKSTRLNSSHPSSSRMPSSA